MQTVLTSCISVKRFKMHQNLKMLLVLSCAFNPPPLTGYGSGRFSGEERIRQYVVGFETFFNGHERFKEFDIILTDNTILGIDEIDTRILSKIPKNTKIFLTRNNQIGSLNNGAGLIFTLNCLCEKIKEYDWVVYHEPRQKTRHFNFIDSFLLNPRNLFSINKENGKHFNTGLFCISSKNLISYCSSADIVEMTMKSISIEDHMFLFFNKEKIPFDTEKEMGITWYPFGSPSKDY